MYSRQRSNALHDYSIFPRFHGISRVGSCEPLPLNLARRRQLPVAPPLFLSLPHVEVRR